MGAAETFHRAIIKGLAIGMEHAYRLGYAEAKAGCMSLAITRDELAQMAALEPDSKAIAEIVRQAGAGPEVEPETGIPY